VTQMSALPFGSWSTCFPHWDLSVFASPFAMDLFGRGPKDQAELDFARTVDATSKTEIHVHAEAAVPQSFYDMLAPEPLPGVRPSSVVVDEEQPGFERFIECWLNNSRRLQSEDHIELLGRSFVALRKAHNIHHSEVHFSPADVSLMRTRRSDLGEPLSFVGAIVAFCKGLQAALREHPTLDVRVIIDVLWLTSREQKLGMLGELYELHDDRSCQSPRGGPLIVGVGLGGPERSEGLHTWSETLAACKTRGLLLDIHCGETATADQARHACEVLKPHRISHGIAGAPQWIFNGPVAACPISNLFTQRHTGPLADHPARQMLTALPTVTINTDDPLLFGTNLTLEYVALRRAWGLTLEDFYELQERAQRSRWSELLGA
jgi:adenosine deaminase